MSSVLFWFGLDISYSRLTESPLSDRVEFERRGYLSDSEGLMKDALNLHYGKHRTQGFWDMDHTRGSASTA